MRAGLLLIAALTWRECVHADPLQTWPLAEHLGHAWSNELVFFKAADRNVRHGQENGYTVVDEAGAAVPFQFGLGQTVAVQVDLPPYARRSFTLRRESGPRLPGRGDVKVEQAPGCFILSAGRTAVKVARAEAFKPGTPYDQLPAPIQAIKGISGRWLGEGKLLGAYPVHGFTTEIEAGGPLFAQVRVRYDFDYQKFHQFRVRVVSGENVALVEEEFALSAPEFQRTAFVTPPDLAPEPGQPSALTRWLTDQGMGWTNVETGVGRLPCFTFNFNRNAAFDRVAHYNLSGAVPVPDTLSGPPPEWARGLVLEPFQSRGLRAAAVGFDEAKDGGDYLGLFTRFPGRWGHPNENRVPIPRLSDGFTAHFLAFEGRREWGLYAGQSGPANADRQDKRGSTFAALRRIQARHGQTPLDKVKDWVLEWDPPLDATWPCLYYSPAGLTRMRKEFPALPPAARAFLKADDGARALLEGDKVAVKSLAGKAASLRVLVNDFLEGGHDTANTYTHRFQECVRSWTPQVDAALGCGVYAPEERKAALASAAFLAYKISDPDYWPYRGYGGGPSNPNMMSIACNALAMSAAVCQGHPERTRWLRLCERLVCADILMSIGPRGEWIESPGYQGAGNTPINQTVLILRNAGIADLTAKEPFGSRLMSVSTYYANLLGPRDPRRDRQGILFGRRMPMALGDNTPFGSAMYVYLAAAGAKAHPVEAGHALWCWNEMGRPKGEMGLLLFHEGLLTGAVQPVPISGQTEVFPGFGVMHRHGFGTPAETFMTFFQNDWAYGHYDDDKGSFSLFAKGAPLCLDWVDYSPGEAAMHNRVDYRPEREPWFTAPPDKAVVHAEADYVRARHAAPPAGAVRMAADAKAGWQRQYILVKDARDPGDATYLVFRDIVAAGRPSTWNVWTLAETNGPAVEVAGATARVTGQFGVDAVFTFYRKPEGPLAVSNLHHQTRSYIDLQQDMARVQAAAERDGDYGVVLYPVRRGVDAAPKVRELPSGAVELAWANGRRHLVFLFPEPREAEETGFRFKGRAGLVKIQDGKTTVVPLECDMLAQP